MEPALGSRLVSVVVLSSDGVRSVTARAWGLETVTGKR